MHNPAVAGVWAWEHGVAGVHREEVRRLARSAFVPAATGRPLLVVPRLLGCRALLLTDDGEEAENHLGALLDESHRERAAISVAHILTVRAELHIRHGRPDAAARDLAAAEAELPWDRLHPIFLPYWLALSMVTDLQNGHTERARETAARPLPPLAHESATTAQLLFARGCWPVSTTSPTRPGNTSVPAVAGYCGTAASTPPSSPGAPSPPRRPTPSGTPRRPAGWSTRRSASPAAGAPPAPRPRPAQPRRRHRGEPGREPPCRRHHPQRGTRPHRLHPGRHRTRRRRTRGERAQDRRRARPHRHGAPAGRPAPGPHVPSVATRPLGRPPPRARRC
ncbi:hypothetical protein OIM90_31115 [Streptomyces sp. AD16]|nr:hypothetical protein OIM90_31115 [Streptomyces sp. AD16]